MQYNRLQCLDDMKNLAGLFVCAVRIDCVMIEMYGNCVFSKNIEISRFHTTYLCANSTVFARTVHIDRPILYIVNDWKFDFTLRKGNLKFQTPSEYSIPMLSDHNYFCNP